MASNITLDDGSIGEIQNEATDIAALEAKQIMEVDLAQLRDTASIFLNTVTAVENKIQTIENLLTAQKNARQGKTKSEYYVDQYITNQHLLSTYLRDPDFDALYSAAMSFQLQLNAFIGQQIEMIFVWTKKNTPTLYVINNEKVLKTDYSSTGHVVARYRANQSLLKDALTKISLDTSDQQGLANLLAAYREVLMRRTTHENTKRVMWLNPFKGKPKWHVAKVQQVGDINEAYANIVLTRQEKMFTTSNDIEMLIEIFMVLFWTGVTNESGVLTGDVEIGNIEYGIKSARATMLSLTQLQNIASQIKNEDVTPDDIRQMKQEMAASAVSRNNIYEDEKMVIEANLEELQAQVNTFVNMHMT